MKVYNYLEQVIGEKGASFLVLVDPDKLSPGKTAEFAKMTKSAGVDAYLLGGSLLLKGNMEEYISLLQKNSGLPVIIFPGSVSQVYPGADAVLYISLVSGRNPDHLIGNHVMAAPYIKKIGIETLSTGYILVESGKVTTAEYMSGSKPIPRDKPEIAMATALASEFMGMKLIYLEGGSGAEKPVPDIMVKMVSSSVNIPVIVGGGIKDAATAAQKVKHGAKIIVTGNHFEDEENWESIKDFASAVHYKNQVII